jgi:hypothetical protein
MERLLFRGFDHCDGALADRGDRPPARGCMWFPLGTTSKHAADVPAVKCDRAAPEL